MALQTICVAYLMMIIHSAIADISLNGPTGTILDNGNWVVLKEEIITPVNNTALSANKSSSDSPKYVQKTILDNTKHIQPEIQNDGSEKDQSLFNCKNITLKVGEYDMYDNGTLHVKAFRKTLNSSFYIENGDNTVTICNPVKKERYPISTPGKAILSILTFAYVLLTMLSAMCGFSKNSTYLQLALVSWICISSNIFLWVIVRMIIPTPESVFSWVAVSVNLNQGIYLISAWMALFTSHGTLTFLQKYDFIKVSNRVVTVRVYRIGALCVILSAVVAIMNFMFENMDLFNDDQLIECLFCNPITYLVVWVIVFADSFLSFLCRFQVNLTDVSRYYRAYHESLRIFSCFNFACITFGTRAVISESYLTLWMYTLFNFLWPFVFLKRIIPRVQTLIAVASEEDEINEKVLISREKVPLNKVKELEM